MDKVNLGEKFALFSDYWSPKIIGDLNGQQVKLITTYPCLCRP